MPVLPLRLEAGIKMREFFKLAAVYLIIFSLLSAVISTPTFSQSGDIVKSAESVPVGEPFFPGSEVKITIEVPGEEIMLRNPTDTMLVMDHSISMDYLWGAPPVSKLYSAKKALEAFVDETKEDNGPGDPGDYVGLVSYGLSATLHFALANMTTMNPDNKTAIKTAINSITTTCCTSIGAGMSLANTQLINNGRPGVPKFMVLATDGVQNTAPSPYQNGILATAINNNFIVFTVGIGDDVRQINNPDLSCPSCFDISGDGYITGEEILKDIACKTDPNCTQIWNPGNSSTINDLDRPDHYFYAPNDSQLRDIYEKIAIETFSIAPYLVLDKINTDLFQANIHDLGGAPNQIDVTDCDTGAPWPTGETIVGGDAFIVVLEDVPKDETVCISFLINIRDDVSFLSGLNAGGFFDINDDVLSRATVWGPDEEPCDADSDGNLDDDEMQECFDRETGLPSRDIQNLPIFVTNPVRPWIKTTDGDVGAKDNIEATRNLSIAPLPPGEHNAQYLVNLGRDIVDDNFTSAKDWLVDGYNSSGGVDIRLDPVGGSFYQALFEDYSRSRGVGTVEALLGNPNRLMATKVEDAAHIESGIVLFNPPSGTAKIDDVFVYDGPPATVFIDGNLRITRNVSLNTDRTGLVFIVNGNILVGGFVTSLEGIYISDLKFKSRDSGPNSNQLTIKGSVISFGGIDWRVPGAGRSLGYDCASLCNLNNPAEVINYQPKYIWLFREILGFSKGHFTEVPP